MYAIELNNLSKDFYSEFLHKPTRVLNNISIHVEYGKSFGLLGANGAGKTTTMKLILGLLKPTEGNIKIFEKPSTNKATRAKIGYMPEKPYFYTYLTGYEFMLFCADLYNIHPNIKIDTINDVLELVGMKGKEHIRLGKCSKGMMQRIGIAQAILNNPELIMLDEPMSGLDPLGRKDIRDIIIDLKNAGKTIFFNSHILSDVEMICDEVAILKQGELLALESKDLLLENYSSLEDFFIAVISGNFSGIPKHLSNVR